MAVKANAVIVAAGAGSRMGDGPRKQYRLLAGRPVLAYTLRAFEDTEMIGSIALVVTPGDEEWCRRDIVERCGCRKVAAVVPGGRERQESVRQGLEALPPAPLVVIHDGVRPFVTREQVEAVVEAAAEHGAATLAVPAKDTVKIGDAAGMAVETLPRERLWLVQTPQAFRRDVILSAHERARAEGFTGTDDASLVERLGGRVALVPGDYANIKITTPEDLTYARALTGEATSLRTGFGYDVHRLVEDRPLILGGVNISYPRGLLGHSDADVLTHAVMDALLGAAALGDIGQYFPDTDPRYEGASSLDLLAAVARLLADKGLTVNNIDATVVAQAPKLAPHIPAMRANLARVLGLNPDRVSVKATTTEGLGFTGTGEGIAAHAVATVVGCGG